MVFVCGTTARVSLCADTYNNWKLAQTDHIYGYEKRVIIKCCTMRNQIKMSIKVCGAATQQRFVSLIKAELLAMDVMASACS